MANKKTKNEKTEEKKAAAKAKAKKPEQLKIAGTGRIDRIEEIEDIDAKYREARDARMSLQEDELEAQEDLTNVLKKHKVDDYVYEGKDGKKYRVYLPKEAKAKSQRVKEPKVPKAA